MHSSHKKLFFLALALFLAAMACTRSATQTPAAIDVQATVDAGIAATTTAQAELQNMVDEAVDGAVELALEEMAEEELAAEIEAAAAATSAAMTNTETATQAAAADDTLTAEEYEELLFYVDEVDEALYYTYALMDEYIYLYGNLAMEYVDLLYILEEDLALIEESVSEIAAILELGLDAATAALTELETAAAQANAIASEVQQQAQNWQDTVAAQIQDRTAFVQGFEATEIAEDRIGTLESLFAYFDGVQAALGDGIVNSPELANIAQLAANAQASLGANGGPQLQGFVPQIDQLTLNLAAGQLPQAKGNFANFEMNLPQRPSRP